MTAQLIDFIGDGPVFTATVDVDGEVREIRTANTRTEFEKRIAEHNKAEANG